METRFYTVKEVATLLQVHWQSVLTYIKSGKLKALRLGKGYRISQESLDNFIAQQSTDNTKNTEENK